ncbi:MAG: type II toxin-antitoxin system VapB family antitoxin [Rhodanobacteraceae bacterium]
MRTTINLDDGLIKRAQRISGVRERSAVIREGLQALIERESARRLARLGGSQPKLKRVPRRRPRLHDGGP